MKKNSIRVLAWILVVFTIISTFPVSVFAETGDAVIESEEIEKDPALIEDDEAPGEAKAEEPAANDSGSGVTEPAAVESYVAKIGEQGYATLAEAFAAVGSDNVAIKLLTDATLDYGAREAFGTADTTSVTINGNGKTLTLNQTNSDWSSFGLANANAKLVLNNMTIEKTGHGDTDGAWNKHAIIFSCNVEMNNVTVNNAIAVQNGAILNNVTINEANGYYGLWINGNGQTVTMTGGVINATNGGRGIKIADQYIDDPKSVTLNVTGTVFNTAKKAAVLISSTAGAAITATEVVISGVAADSTNFVHVDEDWAEYNAKVEVTGATKAQEAVETFVATVGGNYYATFADALAAVQNGETITLINDVTLTETLVIPAGKKLTLDLNGKNVSMVYAENVTANHSMIENKGNLTIQDTVGNGKLSYKYTGASLGTTYAANTITVLPGSVLTVKSGSIENLTYDSAVIAYAIDGQTNGGAGDVTINIEGGIITSLRQAVRIFANSTTNTGALAISGGDITGRVIVQNANTNANKAALAITGGTFNANDYKTDVLYVGGSTGATIDMAPVVSGGTFNGEINSSVPSGFITGGTFLKDVSAYVKNGYKIENNKVVVDPAYGKAAQIGTVYYDTFADAYAAAHPGDTIILLAPVVVAKDDTLTLDKSVTITYSSSIQGNEAMISNKGELVINGTNLVYTYTGTGDPNFGWGTYTIRNEGTLVVNSGTIEFIGNQAFGTHCSLAIFQYSGSTTINGGKIVNNAYRSVRLWHGDMTINGGTFEGQVWVHCVDDSAKLTIKGGTFAPSTNGDGSSVFVNNSGKKAELSITGGTFNTKIGANDVAALAGAITGGKFTEAAKNGTNAALLADDMFFGEVGADGFYGIKNGLEGSGTEADPYQIGSVEDLIFFRDSVNAGETKYNARDMYFVLTADIDLAGENWVGIGSATAAHGFMGNFDGNGYKIKNLTITNPALDSDGYAYAGFFGVTEGIDKDNQNFIKNLTIENVTISTTGHIVAAAIAYPYYTIVDNVKVCGDISITGGDYTAGVLAYTRRCVNASNISIVGNDGSTITGAQTVGGVISDIQMNGGLVANYSNFAAENLTISGTKQVGGISGIISNQALSGATVKNVTLVCSDARVGIVAGSLGGLSTISNVTYKNVTGATAIVGATYDAGAAVQAKIGDKYYATFAEALAAAQDDETITLLWAEGDAPIAMNGSVFGKTVTITGTATVDWSKGFLFVGRGGAGNGTVIFDNANLTSASNNASTGIHVSGREKDTNNKYDGTLVIKDSTIELDYLINKGTMTLDNSTLTVKNGFAIGGRPAKETESGEDATATITLNNGSKVVVNNHNGMGLGYEAIGVMNIDATSAFETTQSFLVTAKGTMNIAGTAKVAGTLTNNGSIVLGVNGTLESSECGNVTVDPAADPCYEVVYADGKYTVKVGQLVIYVNANVATANSSDMIIYVSNMDDAIAQASALDALNVTYKITGAVELTTGFSHGILDLGKNVVIEGVTGTNAKLTIVGGGVPDIKGVTFKNITLADAGTYLPTANEFMYQNYIGCTFEKVTFVDGIRLSGKSTLTDCTIDANTTNEYAIWLDEGEFTMTGSTVTAGNDAYGMIKSDVVDKITISGNTFKYSGNANKEALNTNGAKITASENTFIGCDKGVIPTDKTNYAADGTTVLDNAAIASGNMVVVAQIGSAYYESMADAIAAVGAGNVVIELLTNATLDYGAREAFGAADTTSVTINGNGKTLTLNQTNSDWSSFGLANNAKLVLNNMTIEKTGHGDTSGAWNKHAIIFSCNVEMNNVTVNNAIAVQNGATLNNVTINEAGEYYGLWINGNGQTVTMNGGAINATNGGRGIKIADQYIDAPVSVTLNVTGTKFTTAKKAAVLVSSTAGAKITASKVDITNVAADSTNFVHVDEDWAEYNANVTVTGATKAQEAVENFVATVGGNYYATFADALAAVQNGETITILDVEGNEVSTEIEFTKDIEFTITGKAPNYALPVITFQNATVNIKGAEILIPELDARQNATINVIDSIVHDAGGNGVVKSYYDGAINISGNSVVHTMQVTTMGTITVSGTAKLNATWQTNVYGNGMITVKNNAVFNTAALHLTGQDYSGRDNTDDDRVGKPATIIVDGATFNVGKVYSDNGSDYSYNSSKGINIGTVADKSAVLDIKNGAKVNIYMANGETANIGAGGTVNVNGSTFNVACRAENGKATLANNGTIYVTGTSGIAATVTSSGWVYMNGVTLDSATKLYGAKVAFINGTNNVVGSVIKDGFFSVGVGQNDAAAVVAEFATANNITLGNVTVNVSGNAVIGGNGTTYSGWIGSAYGADKTQHDYVLNIENSLAAFGYLHISKDGTLNVKGHSDNKYTGDGANVDFYAGEFIVNGVATFDGTDAWVKYIKMSVDHAGGVLNIIKGTNYEASVHNGSNASTSLKFWKAGTINVDETSKVEIDNGTILVDGAKLNIGGNVTASGAVTGNGIITLTAVDATLTAPAGLTVDSGNKCYHVVYKNGVYKMESYVAMIGDTGYTSLADAIAAVGEGDVVIKLLTDATLDYGAREAYGVAGTNSVTINGNGHTLKLNQTNSDWASIGLANANAKLVLNDMTINKNVAPGNGAWNNHAIIFSCNVVMTDVTVKNGIAVQNGATLNNVTIYEDGEYYGLWINGNGQTVTMNGGSITAPNSGRGIKIADQYISAPASVNLTVDGTKFNTAKKAAILVSSTAGADITATNVDITNVAADSTNVAWVDEDWATSFGNVTVNNAPAAQESATKFGIAIVDSNDNVIGYYQTLKEAIEAATEGATIKLLVDVTKNVTVNKKLTINLNGKTITSAVSTIVVDGGELTITGDGKIVTTDPSTDYDSAYEAIAVKNNGKLILNGGSVEAKTYGIYVYSSGGTVEMKGGSVVSETYRAIVVGNGKATISGGSVSGIVHAYTNYGGSVEITGGTFSALPDAAYVAYGYAIEQISGTTNYQVVKLDAPVASVNGFEYYTIAAAIAAANDGDVVMVAPGVYYGNLSINKKITLMAAASTFRAVAGKPVTVNGTLSIIANDTTVSGMKFVSDGTTLYINAKDVTIDNCEFTGGWSAMYQSYTTGKVTLKNSTFTSLDDAYAIHFDGSAGGKIEIDNCVITGWTSFAASIKTVTVKDTTFAESEDNNNVLRFYQENIVIEGCTFNKKMSIDLEVPAKVTVKNSKFEDGSSITGLFSDEEIKNCIITVGDEVLGRAAKIGETYYDTLQKAIDAAVNGDTIILVSDCAEDVIVVQAPDVKITIDGAGKTMTGTITVNGKSAAYSTAGLTIKNVNFDATSISQEASINLGVKGDNNTRYTSNVTVENCNFKGNYPATEKAAIKNYTGGCKNLTVTNCTATNMHSMIQVKGVGGMTVKDVNISNCKNGIAVGTSTDVTITKANITAAGYGIRADGEDAYNLTVKNSTITAKDPVVVRKNTADGYELTLEGNTLTGTNYGVIITKGDDGTYETPGVSIKLSGVENSYPVYQAKIGDDYYATIESAFEAAFKAAQADATIKIISNVTLTEALVIPAEKSVTLNLNGKTISMVDTSGATACAIKNNGNLTIIDTSAEKDGKITFNSTTPSMNNAYASNTISNYGTITVKAGTIENTTAGSACYALDNYAGSTATISGGKLVAKKTTVRIFNWTNGDAAKATLNVDGGEIISNEGYAINVNSGNAPAVALNITGGIITTADTNYNLAVYIVNKGSAENLTVNINGGTFDGYFALNGITSTTMSESAVSITGGTLEGVICYENPAYGFISGGTFKTAVAENLCANGYIPKDNGDGTYGVKAGKYVARNITTGAGYETVAEAFAAAQDGDEIVILAAGIYKVPTGKNITITGAVDGVEFDMSKAVGINASMTFNNVTFNYGNANYVGLQHSGNLVYNNCTINGQVFLYGTSETFNNCTFNQDSADAYNVWTYGAKKVAFNECTFNSAGKAVLIYSDQAGQTNDVSFTKSTLNASAAVAGKAAIEMDSSLQGYINLTIDGATTATGFGKGNVSDNSLWNNKKDNKTDANNDITVVVDGDTVLAPVTFVVQVGNEKYASLQAAIAAANAGDTVTFLVDITENVTISKSLIIDGANKKYTGTMTVNKINVTIQNVKFVMGCIYKGEKTGGNYTIKNCAFDGNNSPNIDYAINMAQSSMLVIENVTAKHYNYGFLQVSSSTDQIFAKDVEISDVNYGFKINRANKVTLENVKMTEVKQYGVWDSNYGAKTYHLTDCTIIPTNKAPEGEGYQKPEAIFVWVRNDTVDDTFIFYGDNNIPTLINCDHAIYKMAAGATIKAPAGLSIDEYKTDQIDYINGVYSAHTHDYAVIVTDPTYTEKGYTTYTCKVCGYSYVDENSYTDVITGAIAQIGDKLYGSLADALADAKTGDTVVLLENITVSADDGLTVEDKYKVIFVIDDGKDITLDMNGKSIFVSHPSTTDRLYAVVCVEDGAGLTVTGNGSIDVTTDETTPKVAYMFWKRGTTGHLTINSGSFHMNNSEDSMIYTNGNEIVTINGGTYSLDANGTRVNGFPWIFNTYGNNAQHINVNGGTFNYDINHQYWCFEVKVADGKAVKDNGDDTWTITNAVAYVSEKVVVGEITYIHNVGYETFAEALAAAKVGETITIVAPGVNIGDIAKNVNVNNGSYVVTVGVLSAGTYNWNISGYCADGYCAQDNGDGTWTVVAHNYVPTVTDPTFDTQGYTTYKCEVCGDSYVRDPVPALVAVAQIGDTKYGSLADAIAAAQSGNIVKIIKDIALDLAKATAVGDYKALIYINQDITLDLNGCKITAADITAKGVFVFYAVEGASVTIKDSIGTSEVNTSGSGLYYMFSNAGAMTIESGKYIFNGIGGGAMFYSLNSNMTVTGGNFTQKSTGWMFNADGNGKHVITVSGGTFNRYFIGSNTVIPEENTWGEVVLADGKCLHEIGENQWTVDKSILGEAVREAHTDETYGLPCDYDMVVYCKVCGNELSREHIAVGLEDAVAWNKNANKLYETLAEALAEAQSGETVVLLTDLEESVVMLTNGITLDLNGKTLTAGYLVAFNGNYIVDNSDTNAGLLKGDKDRLILAKNNEQLPVWDGAETAKGYRFVEVLNFNADMSKGKFVFQPIFEEYAHALILQGKDLSGVSIVVRVSWTNSDRDTRSQDFDYSDAMVSDVINSYKGNGKYGKMYSLKLTNTDNISNLSYTVVLTSDTGVEVANEATTHQP